LTNKLIDRSEGSKSSEPTQGEVKMEPLFNQQMWEIAKARHAEMIQEAQNVRLARLARESQPGWLSSLFRRQAQTPTLALEPSATPELG
jgi:hypothetical protein